VPADERPNPGDRTDPIAPDRAVVDRIVDGETAVLLLGPAEEEVLLPAASLPPGATEGSWVVVDREVTPPEVVEVDAALTDARAEAFDARLERLRRDRRGGRFGR
jgi:hypothetical protein